VTVAGTVPHAYGLCQQSWWLEAVAPGAWDAVTLEAGGAGGVLAWLPFLRKRKLGLTILTQPPLTPFLGPWLEPLASRSITQIGQQHKILEELVARLPRHDVLRQSFHHSVGNCCRSSGPASSRQRSTPTCCRTWATSSACGRGLESDKRRMIRKAEQELAVRVDDDIDKFLHFHRAVFARRSLPLPYPRGPSTASTTRVAREAPASCWWPRIGRDGPTP
jgi:hypothetical protein